jgi:integrase
VAAWLSLPAAEFFSQLQSVYKPYALKTTMIRAADFKAWQGDDSYKQFMKTNARLFKNAYEKKLVGLTYEQAREKITLITGKEEREAAMLMLTTGMRVHEALKYDGSGKVIGKGAKQRNIYSNAIVSGDTNYDSVYRELKKVGLKPHDLRKLAATQLAKAGFKEADLMAVMGWSNIQTASNYLQPMQEASMAAKLQEALK